MILSIPYCTLALVIPEINYVFMQPNWSAVSYFLHVIKFLNLNWVLHDTQVSEKKIHLCLHIRFQNWKRNSDPTTRTRNSCSYSGARRQLCTLRGPHSTLDLLAISEMPHCADGSPSKAPMLGQVGVRQETAGKQAHSLAALLPRLESFLGWQQRVKEGNLVIANLPLLARYQECVIFII